jgi:uncharacterized protein
MRKSAYALVFCLLLAPASHAQQNAADTPASKADVQRFLDTMHTRDMMTQMMAVMKNQMRQMIHAQLQKQSNLPADSEAKIDKMTDDLLSSMPIDDLLQAMIPVYQKHLTKGDIDALIAFYSSPVGQKMIKEMPAMTAEAMQASQGIMQRMMAQTMQRVQEQIAQLQQNSGATRNN